MISIQSETKLGRILPLSQHRASKICLAMSTMNLSAATQSSRRRYVSSAPSFQPSFHRFRSLSMSLQPLQPLPMQPLPMQPLPMLRGIIMTNSANTSFHTSPKVLSPFYLHTSSLTPSVPQNLPTLARLHDKISQGSLSSNSKNYPQTSTMNW